MTYFRALSKQVIGMGSEGRSISTRQVRALLGFAGLLVIVLAVLLARREAEDVQGPRVSIPRPAEESPRVGEPAAKSTVGDPGQAGPSIAPWRRAAESPELIQQDEIPAVLERADQALEEGRLAQPPGDNALDLYRAILEADPDNEDAAEGFDLVVFSLLEKLREAVRKHRFERARELISTLDRVAAAGEEVDELARQLDRAHEADALMEAVAGDLEAGHLVEPSGENALARLNRVEELEPGRVDAQERLVELEQLLIGRALEAARNDRFARAEDWLQWARSVRGGSSAVRDARGTVSDYRDVRVRELTGEARGHMAQAEFELAEQAIERIAVLGGSEAMVQSLRDELKQSRRYGRHRPGQVFQDPFLTGDGRGPTMVVIPYGDFFMGSSEEEPGHRSSEEPRHRVSFSRGFGLASTEVNVALFRRFVEATGYLTDAEKDGFSSVYNEGTGRMARSRGVSWRDGFNGKGARDDEPVVHVSWNDAMAFARWLSEQTGRAYRLPSEAEFEYALRGRSDTIYWWGRGSPERAVENLTGDGDRSSRGRRWTKAFEDYSDGYWGLAPTGALEPNAFLLFDMAGNVEEWVEDCWHDSYVRAPADGSAWVNRGCRRRVLRGSFWGGAPETARSAYRNSHRPSLRGSSIGFRVARDLGGES